MKLWHNKNKKLKKCSVSNRKNIVEAYTFMLPFIVGVALFFAFPIVMSLRLSFGTLTSMKGFEIEWSGLTHYINAFVVDAAFIPTFLEAVKKTVVFVPLIIIFSLILAILLNKNIKFKGFFRVAMFLPFLLGSGYMMKLLTEQGITSSALSLTDSPFFPVELLNYLSPTIRELINDFFEIIVSVLWSSGVQILIFLSGLQGVPVPLYESAQVDGASEIEIFFKITLPMMSPIITLNIIYTLVNLFTASDNSVLTYIQTIGFNQFKWEYSAALGWIYFAFIALFVAIVLAVMKKISGDDKMNSKRRNRL